LKEKKEKRLKGRDELSDAPEEKNNRGPYIREKDRRKTKGGPKGKKGNGGLSAGEPPPRGEGTGGGDTKKKQIPPNTTEKKKRNLPITLNGGKRKGKGHPSKKDKLKKGKNATVAPPPER